MTRSNTYGRQSMSFYTFSIESLLDIAAESLKLRRTRLLDNVGKFYFVSCAPQLFCSFFKEIRSENRCSVAAEIRLINPGRNRLRFFYKVQCLSKGFSSVKDRKL